MIPLNYAHRVCTGGYNFTKLQEKIIYLMYMDDDKLFDKNEKELKTLRKTMNPYSQDTGMEFGTENMPCSK